MTPRDRLRSGTPEGIGPVWGRSGQLALKIDEYTDTHGDGPVWRNRLAVHDLWLAQTDLLIGWLERLPGIIAESEPRVGDALADLTTLALAAAS